MMRVVLASHNPGKLRELQTLLPQLLHPLPITLENQHEHNVPSAPETGTTFIENALIKARAVTAATGLAALADDSGIVVPALNGAPGIYSARFAGIDEAGSSDEDGGLDNVPDQDPQHMDQANNRKLIAELQGVSSRVAYFYCAIVFLRHTTDPAPVISTASWYGQIIDVPRGTQGFGYDPHFYLPELQKTSAELSADEKNARSHRGQAIAKLCAELKLQLTLDAG